MADGTDGRAVDGADDGAPAPAQRHLDGRLRRPTRRAGRRPHPAPARRGGAPRRPAADHRRGRLGQDPGADPAHRPPARHRATPRPGASWPSPSPTRRRTRCARRVADLVGPPAEKMWVSTFHSACLRILRTNADRLGYRSAFTVYDDTDSRRLVEMITAELGFDQKRLPSRAVQGVISQAKSELIDFETFREEARSGPDPFRKRIADDLRAVPGPPAGGQRARLRRPADGDGQPAPGLRRRAGLLPGALPAHPGRRVPGHQPRPERDRQAAGRGARQRLRGGRLRPVGLPLARRGHPQHLGVRAGLPQRDDDHAGAELPLDPDDPRRGQRRHRQQRRPPAQGALHRRRHRRAGHALPGRGRARRGGVGLRRDPAPARVGRADVGRRAPSSTAPTRRACRSRRP